MSEEENLNEEKIEQEEREEREKHRNSAFKKEKEELSKEGE